MKIITLDQFKQINQIWVRSLLYFELENWHVFPTLISKLRVDVFIMPMIQGT